MARTFEARHYVLKVALRKDKIDSFDRYPFSLPAVRHLDGLEFHPAVTFLVGENGTGKSTLLEAIAVAFGFNAEGGTRNFNFATRSSHSDLHDCLRLTKGVRRPRDGFFLRAESLYNVATQIEKLDEDPAGGPRLADSYGGESLHAQSHGESFLAVFMNRFGANGLYILDEPEAALSPSRQMALLTRMHDLVNDGCQFIIATHAPILMAYPNARILSLSADGIEAVDYESTEHYKVTRYFLNNREKVLRDLLGES